MRGEHGGILKKTFRAFVLLLLIFISLQETSGLMFKWSGSTLDYLLLGLFLILALTAIPIHFRIKPFKYIALMAALTILSLNINKMAVGEISPPLIITSVSLLFVIVFIFSLIRSDKF